MTSPGFRLLLEKAEDHEELKMYVPYRKVCKGGWMDFRAKNVLMLGPVAAPSGGFALAIR